MQVRFALAAAALAAMLIAPAQAGISKKANAQKVIAFMDLVFNQKKVKEGFDKYVGDKYIQHNPIAPDGAQAAVEVLGKALEALAWGIVVAASARGLRPAPGAEDEDDDFD